MSSKNSVADLAICGGSPGFAAALHVGRPNIGDREQLLTKINDILDRVWLTNDGPYVQEFERQVAARVGARHCVAVCNATIALELAVRALGLSGEVIVPAMTFIASAHVLQWQGITPVFCDIDPATHTLDPDQIESLINAKTTGILGVHVWGRACPIEPIDGLRQRYGLKVLYDAAHAFGCTHRGQPLGVFGDAEVFSFHATKVCNSFEGGMVATNDDALAARLRLMRNFGFSGYDHVTALGINGKMTEVAAAMGLTSLASLDEFIRVNQRNYEHYRQRLLPLPGVKMLEYDSREKNNYQYIVLEIDEAVARISRDEILAALWAENVLARRYFYPGCHRMAPYHALYPASSLRLPETEKVVERVLVLPTGVTIGAAEIDAIGRIMELVLANPETVRAALTQRARLASSASPAAQSDRGE